MRTGRPLGTAPCLDQPCGKLGRGTSGLCVRHYKQLWQRTRRFRRLLGTDLTFAAIRDGLERVRAGDPVAVEALAVVRRLIGMVDRGTLLVIRNGQLGQRLEGREARCRRTTS